MESFAFVPTEVFDHTKVAMYLPIRKQNDIELPLPQSSSNTMASWVS